MANLQKIVLNSARELDVRPMVQNELKNLLKILQQATSYCTAQPLQTSQSEARLQQDNSRNQFVLQMNEEASSPTFHQTRNESSLLQNQQLEMDHKLRHLTQ